MNIISKISEILLILLAVSCTHRCKITERAMRQLPVSLDEQFSDFVPGFSDLKIQNLKTVYENDSICLLQFTAAFKDSSGTGREYDLRYVYLFDRFMSYSEGKAVFEECFKAIPCLPDKLIKECRDSVRINKESVFNNAIGSTIEVRTPFDKK